MMNFTPADASAANTLLAIIADPHAAKAALDELVAAKEAADAGAANARAEYEGATSAIAEARVKFDLLATAQTEHEAKVADDKEQLDRRADALVQGAAQLRQREAELDEARKQHQQKVNADYAVSAQWDEWKAGEEKRLADEKAELEAREAAVADAESKANAMLADYSNKLARLKQLTE